MLNNGAHGQNDAYPGIQGYQQYGQNMTSSLNAQQGPFASQQKRPNGPVMQTGMQQGMAGLRQPAQRPAIRYGASTSYAAGRGMPAAQQPSVSGQVGGNPPHLRQGQVQYGAASSALPMRGGTSATSAQLAARNPHASIQSELPFLQQAHLQGGMPFGAQQQQPQQPQAQQQQGAQAAQQLHGSGAPPQQHPAQRVKSDRRGSLGLFESLGAPGQSAPSAPSALPQQQGAEESLAARFRGMTTGAPGSTAAAAAARKGMPGANGKAEADSGLDSSDFPALGGAATASRASAAAQDMSLNFAALAGGVKKADGGGSGAAHASFGSQQSNHVASNGLLPGRAGGGAATEAAAATAAAATPGPLGRALPPPADDSAFLLADLLPLCPGRRRRDDPDDRHFLSVGVDVETLGMNLCSRDDIHPTLASPFAVGGRGGESDVPLPASFLFAPPKLTPAALKRCALGSVLFLFYAFAGARLGE